MSNESRITCEVIKDLLPLYVDEVLSDDSRALVETHIESCEDCKRYHDRLLKSEKTVKAAQENANSNETNEKAQAALRKINNTIKTRRFKTIVITVVLIFAILSGLYYTVCVKESYVPYGESGIYVKDEKIMTDYYYRSYGFDCPDRETLFIFLSRTAFDKKHYNKGITIDLVSLDEESLTTYDEETWTKSTIKEIYYVPEEIASEYKKSIRYGKFWNDSDLDPYADQSDHEYMKKMHEAYVEANKDKVEQIKRDSVMIWKKE